MRRIGVPVCGLLLVALVACGAGGGQEQTGADAGPQPDDWAPPAGSPDITGPVATVTAAAGGDCPGPGSDPDAPVSSDDASCAEGGSSVLATVTIEDGSGRFDAASITLSDQTELRRRTPTGYPEVQVSDVTDGTAVEVWFEGPVAESFPVQGRAGTLILTG